jgi:hypothetical protein
MGIPISEKGYEKNLWREAMKTNRRVLKLIRMGIVANDYKQKDLARMIGMSGGYLSSMLNGDAPMPDDVLDFLLDTLDLRKAYQQLFQIGRSENGGELQQIVQHIA